MLNTARRKWRLSESRGSTAGMQHESNERLRELLFRVAYKQLAQGEWKRLAHHWAFTEEQIKAIEHQYTGTNITRPKYSIVCCINRFTSLCKNLFNLLEFFAKAFPCHVHHAPQTTPSKYTSQTKPHATPNMKNTHPQVYTNLNAMTVLRQRSKGNY